MATGHHPTGRPSSALIVNVAAGTTITVITEDGIIDAGGAADVGRPASSGADKTPHFGGAGC